MEINEYQRLAMRTLNPELDQKDVLINIPKEIDDAYLEGISSWLTVLVTNKRLDEALMQVRCSATGNLAVHREFAENLLPFATTINWSSHRATDSTA